MDQNKKATILAIVIVLILCIGSFVFLLAGYNPPKKEEIRRESQEIEPIPVEKQKQEDTTNKPSTDAAPEKSNIKIELRDANRVAVPNISCNLYEINRPTNPVTRLLYSKRSDESGICFFYNIEPSNSYSVELFSDSDRTFHQTISIGIPKPGETVNYDVLVNINQNNQTGCIDSDGSNIYNKGYVEYQGEKIYDVCSAGNRTLNEFICVDSADSGFVRNVQFFHCANDCQDGACIN